MLLTLCLAGTASGADVLVLQSSRSQAYTDAIKGFRASCRCSEQLLVLSDYAEVDVPRLVREERPRLVLAVGDPALDACRKVREVPVVSLLALSLNLRQFPENVGGVAMTVAPGEYLDLFEQLGVRRVGVPYDPKRTGTYLKRAEREARQRGILLAAEPVGNPRELQARLEKLKGGVDSLWMLPDSTVVTTVNLEALLLFSITQNVPTITFTGHYLKNGAAVALDVDHHDMGVQAGEIASSLLRGGGTRRVPLLDPRKIRQNQNESVLRKLHLKIQ